jgi:hypothetical protein
LREAYPAIPVAQLFSIARTHGAERFPAGFLVSGRLRDRSSAGPRALLRRVARGDDSVELHPLFSATFYRLANDDLAGAGVAAWLHYQVNGRLEERSPHPLIDLKHLAAGMRDIAPSDLVDRYLADPAFWTAEPGPYVECDRFMLFGEWDRISNPLQQIVTGHLRSQWVHSRLMLVDVASQSDAVAHLAAAGFLLSRNGGRNRLAELARLDHSAVATDGTIHTVIPGFLLATDGHLLQTVGNDAVSPDLTAVHLRAHTLVARSGGHSSVRRLVWLQGHLDRHALRMLVEAEPNAVIAPASSAQETSLRQLRRDLGNMALTVLAFGVQTTLTAPEVRVVAAAPLAAPPLWSWGESDYGSVAIVLAESSRRRATGDPQLRAALAAGADLCLISGARLNSWLPQLQARDTVIVEASLVEPVAAFVAPSVLRLLPKAAGS